MQIPAWHAEDVVKVLHRLRSDPRQGLATEEVEKRLTQFGPNELRKEEKASPFSLFLSQFKNVLIIILLAAIVLSVLIGEVLDAVMISAIVLFSALLGFIQEHKAEQALEALKRMLSPMITVLRNGKEEEIPSRDLVPGDILLLEAGDKIPADARLVEVHLLDCDEAALTGESVPVRKETAPLRSDILASDRKNMVFAGTIVTYGRGKAAVTATGMNTEFGRIAEEVAAAETKKTPLEKRTEEIGRWLGIMAVSICVLVAGVSALRKAFIGRLSLEFMIDTVMFAVALAIAAVPEALTAIVTGALAIGMHQMAKRNALVRKMPAVETLGCATVICSDKTGTLTKGEMTVRKIYAAGNDHEVSGVGYEPVGEILGAEKKPDPDSPLGRLFKAALLCNDAQLQEIEGKWTIKGDPTEGALVVVAAKAGLHVIETRLSHPRIEEIPFSSERKRMTTIHDEPDGRRIAYLKGAPEEILDRCRFHLTEKGVLPFSTEEKEAALEANRGMAQAALRVLGMAMKFLLAEHTRYSEEDERGMVFLGLIGMMDPPRAEAIEAVKTCQRIKIRTVLITGDHEITARAVAEEIGIYREGDLVLNGEKLAAMNEGDLEKVVDRVTVYARVSPIDKLKIVRAWKSRGEVVAMTGDGVNDAPALKQADIGIAMGITGTEVTKDAADLVLSDDNFATILKAIERGRWIYDNIKKYLTYLLRCNITEVAVIGGIVLIKGPDYLPLLAAAILYINLATDGLPALALGIAPPEPDIMERPPRDPRESVFSWDVKAFILMALVIETPFFYLLFFHDFSHLEHARTEIFFMFIIVELVIVLNFRSLRFSIFKVPPHRWLILAILWELVLVSVLVRIPSVRDAFGILIPTISDLGIIFGFSIFVFAAMEIAKAALRRKLARADRRDGLSERGGRASKSSAKD
ncbi:MAG: cation-translocating P-type ATPase [Candidatus Aminicenantales bacterium]